MDLGLSGKNIVVTGGSRGIGKHIALGFAREGANVAICARNEEALREVEEKLAAKQVTVYAKICDVADTDGLNSFLEESKQRLGSIDILVNNASPMVMTDDNAAWETNLNIDLMASVRATRKVIPWMIEAGEGCLLFISSISGIEAGSSPAYAAAKAAIISYSKNLSVTLAPQCIRVNTIAPGSIEFQGGSWEVTKKDNRAIYDDVLRTTV